MPELLTLQDLANGHLDVKALGEAANGDENTIVTTRTGNTYPSAERAINIMFKNGGLPAEPFETKAQMTSEGASLPDGQLAMVHDDTANNGLYVKTAGAWVKSAYDPESTLRAYFNTLFDSTKGDLTLANKILREDIDKKLFFDSSSKNSLIEFLDAEYSVYAYFDDNADLHLTGMNDSVQDSINNVTRAIETKGQSRNLTHAFTDANDNIMLGVNANAGLMLQGLTVSVQEMFSKSKNSLPYREYTQYDMVDPSAYKYFLNSLVSGFITAPLPLTSLPQDFVISNDFVSNISVVSEPMRHPINTPYGADDKVVHPYVCEFRGGFRGYRYLMCINPYSHVTHENPVLLGSNDLKDWKLLDGFPQPLESPVGNRYFSDSGLSYDPINGLLICYWRDGDRVESGSDQIINYKVTRDGITWSETKLLMPVTEGTGHLSPSLLFNTKDGLWHLFSGSGYDINHYTSKTLNPNSWVLIGSAKLFGLWHSEVKFIGDKYVILVNRNGINSNYYFASSSDGITWVSGSNIFAENQDNAYKASFIPKYDNGKISFDIAYTTNHATVPENKRKFYLVSTNQIDTQ